MASPRTLLFKGEFGTGKTTIARILAKSLNCESRRGVEPCGSCENCVYPLESDPFYNEYDAAVVGNVESVKELRDTFYSNFNTGYRVILFDESHVISHAAQNALLKIIEESPDRAFFIFATTDSQRLLPTILSRSLDFHFETVPLEEVVTNINNVCLSKGWQFSPKALSVVAQKSNGHMRNAHMLLDKLNLLGEEDFLSSTGSAYRNFVHYFIHMIRGDREKMIDSLNILSTTFLPELLQDFNRLLSDLARASCGCSSTEEGKILYKVLGNHSTNLIRNGCSEWVQSSFSNDYTFQAMMLSLKDILGIVDSKEVTTTQSTDIYSRAVKR